ncbi:MAG: EutN/CcmL family microcompartment protein [Acidobacteriota bacterium]|nr:EutN/CcmL family microcompartment protein [Acidobacteriota bacterium]
MKLGRVAGTVVSTVCAPVFEARSLLLCDLEDELEQPRGSYVIAVDAVGVGVGERVLILDEGNSARQVVAIPDAPIRAVIVGKIDAVESTDRD